MVVNSPTFGRGRAPIWWEYVGVGPRLNGGVDPE